MAVAGFTQDDLTITQEQNMLMVAGQKSDEGGENGQYLHRGIATRAFQRRFELADHVKVVGASLVGRSNNQVPTVFRDDDRNPFLSLHREVNRLFDDVFRGFDGRLPTFVSRGAWPSVEISETDKELKVTAEMPGLEGEALRNGEKDKHFSERFYGHFERRIPLGVEVEEDKIDARFKNGVLNIVLPKSTKAQSQVKRIAIKS